MFRTTARLLTPLIALAAALCLPGLPQAGAQGGTAFQEGGLKDLSTGLVWSRSHAAEFPDWGLSTWDGAQMRAAGYSVVDNGVTYDDWRVPTVAQLQEAISNGTMQAVFEWLRPPFSDHHLWSSQKRGNKAWAVFVEYDGTTITGGGDADLWLKGSGWDVHFVRGGL